MKKTLGDYVVLIISIVGSFASTVAFTTIFSDSLNAQGWLGVLFLGILAIFFLTYNFYLISKYRKKVRYSDVFEELNYGFSSLHKIDRQENQSSTQIIDGLVKLCNSISSAFTKVNGHQISVCIKFIEENDGGRGKVTTLVRDEKSTTKGRKTGPMDKTNHWLDQNSDFNFFYSNFDDDSVDTSYFYKTRLPIREGYLNTRLKNNWPPKKVKFLNNLIRRKNWPLNYKSTLVVPIVPLLANEQLKSGLRGFLCLDSQKEVAFNQHVDVEILKGICDGLYNKIDKLHQLL